MENFKVGNFDVRILQDDDAPNPRTEWDNLGTMYCKHRRYDLGDSSANEIDIESFKGIVLPLYLYDHSGLTIATNRFSCSWDNSDVGYIYVSDDAIRKEYSAKRITKQVRERVINCLVSEVETYDQYLTGDVWGYQITDSNGDEIDSCWGFYGFDYCKREAIDQVNYEVKEAYKKALFYQLTLVKVWIKNKVPLDIRQATNLPL